MSSQRDRFLRHSDTGPSPAGDWSSPEPTTSPSGSRSSKEGACARPRAWSVRTFQDFLPPLPQLHKKWCSWNSTSPFTKLVDSVSVPSSSYTDKKNPSELEFESVVELRVNGFASSQAPSSLVAEGNGTDGRKVFSDAHLEAKADASTVSDSSISNASYPLTQSAQRQRRLNSISNLRRSRFTGPCFGLLSATPEPAKAPGGPQAESPPSEPGSSSSSSTQGQTEGDHVSVPVFAISEEEDRQPLVPCEPPGGVASASAVLNGLVRGAYEGKKPAAAAISLHPQNQRARPEWRPWGSQVSGGVALPSAGDAEPSLRRSTVLCSVTNQM